MAIRRILVPTSGRYSPNDPENLDRPAITAGLAVAGMFKARVNVLSVIETESTAEPQWKSWLPGHGIDPLLKEIVRLGRVRRKHARAAFDAEMKTQADQAEGAFIEEAGNITGIVGTHGRLSDLIVLANSRARWELPKRPIMETVLWQTGRPVLVVPQSTKIRPFRKIHFAWNNSPASARALQASLPILQQPDTEVTIVTKAEKEKATVGDLGPVCQYLEEHGVMANGRVLEASGHRTPANAIADFANAEGCDLLVLGSVFHFRARSLVFGSLTHRVLSRPETPVLLCP